MCARGSSACHARRALRKSCGARSGKLTATPTTSSGSLRLQEPGPRQSNNDPSDSGHGDIGREHKYHDNLPAWAPSPGWAPSNDGVVRVCAGNVIDTKHALTAPMLQRTLSREDDRNLGKIAHVGGCRYGGCADVANPCGEHDQQAVRTPAFAAR